MQLYYHRSSKGNFGDDMNQWIWEDLNPDFFNKFEEDIFFSGIGTIISKDMPMAKKWIVFSSGVGYGYPPPNFGDINIWDIISVRGPLSAKVLGLEPRYAITDGAALLSLLSEFTPLEQSERKGVIFIPHHNALYSADWGKICSLAGVEFVTPEQDSKTVIHKIRGSKLVLADAMHAAIVADALRVPWVPMVSSSQINTFKWLDWTQTINIDYQPFHLGSCNIREIIKDNTLRFYGENYYQHKASIDNAVAYFKKQQKLKSKGWWPIYSKIAKKITYRLPDKIITKIESHYSWGEDRYINNVASNLKKASEKNGFLSDEKVFNKNVTLLYENLQSLLKKYAI